MFTVGNDVVYCCLVTVLKGIFLMHKEYLDYYAKFNEDERLISQNITRLEFDTTVRQLEPHIRSAKTLTELGAATGRYSIYYAKAGLDVTAVELVPELTTKLDTNAKSHKVKIHIHEANAKDVPFIESDSQDVVLVLGPLYHIQNEADRKAVIHEAHRILKPNGVVAIAYISRFFIAGLLAKISGKLVSNEVLSELNEAGVVTSMDVDAFFRTGYFAKPSEIEALAEGAGLNVERHVATDGHGRYMSTEMNALSESQYQAWLQYHLSVCDEPSLLGSSNHGLVIARKNNVI